MTDKFAWENPFKPDWYNCKCPIDRVRPDGNGRHYDWCEAKEASDISNARFREMAYKHVVFCMWCGLETEKIPEVMAEHTLSCGKNPLAQWDKEKSRAIKEAVLVMQTRIRVGELGGYSTSREEEWLSKYGDPITKPNQVIGGAK